MEFRRFEGIINSRLDLFLFVEKEVNSSMNNFCIWNLFLGEEEGKKNWRGVLNYFDFVWGSSRGVLFRHVWNIHLYGGNRWKFNLFSNASSRYSRSGCFYIFNLRQCVSNMEENWRKIVSYVMKTNSLKFLIVINNIFFHDLSLKIISIDT